MSDAHDEHEHHAHEHDGAAGHRHAIGPDADARWLLLALAINLGFMLAEIVGAILADSLALLSDAAHMLTDAGAIALALVALRLARRPPSGPFTFGMGRAEILSAQVNGAGLLVLGAIIGVEAVTRLADPPAVEGGLMLWLGVAGAGANGAAAWALARASRDSLNVRGAVLHNLFDLFASLAAALAGALVLAFGWNAADPALALLVCVLMLHGGWGLIRDSGRVLLEAAPAGLDPAEVGRTMAAFPGVVEVHDLHVWEITSGFPAVAAHVLVAEGQDCHARRRDLQRLLGERFGLRHTTLQVDHAHADDGLLQIEAPADRGRP